MSKSYKYLMVQCYLLLITFSSAANSQNRNETSLTGRIEVRGELVENACRLELDSAYQEIDLGVQPTSHFQLVGDYGKPVSFELTFMDCLRTGSATRDDRSGSQFFDNYQPSVTVSFLAAADSTNSDLVAASGTSGLGLIIKDQRNRAVRIGFPGQQFVLTPGQDSIRYTITPVRTAEPLIAGAFYTTIFFHMMYN
ncbi:fimbrial protein [uncultured Pluralibacter sp.]|uniref:fimbrial protein n=1 Tax=uncultured Pluralibacter sp. TaxID=1490864 RepID=UPI0026037B07|nr:fimbrial protein [uncultured Pluralibacter sp.]